jgi:hypothetical protein
MRVFRISGPEEKGEEHYIYSSATISIPHKLKPNNEA